MAKAVGQTPKVAGNSQIHPSYQLMGVLNVTPDSFSDGGQFNRLETALEQAEQLIKSGADLIDIGGESSRPNAEPVPVAQELQRTIPVIQALKSTFPHIPLSIDTSKLEVMQKALEAGATIINDITGLQSVEKANLASQTAATVCVMHMQGTPQTMQLSPHYQDVTETISQFFQQAHQRLTQTGIKAEKIIYDPGFGFGKTLAHNIQLFKDLAKLKNLCQQLGGKLLIGVSRKSMIGAISNTEKSDERIIGSVSAALLAVQRGVDILRVHDVAETHQALITNHVLG